jgi:hypothetical protein
VPRCKAAREAIADGGPASSRCSHDVLQERGLVAGDEQAGVR